MTKKPSKEPKISGREIHRRVVKRLTAYDKLNHLERFAMFLGKAQVLEFGLKSLLARRYDYEPDRMERWTLGTTTHELEKAGLRGDYIALLKVVVRYRNHVAHEYLAGMAMLRILLRGNTGRLGVKHLEKGAYELERVILLYDWCEKHDAWEFAESLPTPASPPAQS
jgi:hypothetical protein